jgi:hypothetical protein
MPTFKLSKADREKITAAAKRTEEPAAALTAAVEAYTRSPIRSAVLPMGVW